MAVAGGPPIPPDWLSVDELVRELGSLATLDAELARAPEVRGHSRVLSAQDALQAATAAVANALVGPGSTDDSSVLIAASQAVAAAREAVEHARGVVQEALARRL
jgi:hypothetical protein